jgi:hypothetical protein
MESTFKTYDGPNNFRRGNGIVKDLADMIKVTVYLSVEVVKIFLNRRTFICSNVVNAAHANNGCSDR